MNNKYRNITLENIKTPKNPHIKFTVDYFVWKLGIEAPEYYQKLLQDKLRHQATLSKKIKL